jgi:hypothetical protein
MLNAIIIPKLWFSERHGRFLTFREVLTTKAGIATLRQIDGENIKVIDNSAEDLLEGVRLMHELTSADGQNYRKFMKSKSRKQKVIERIWRETNHYTQPAIILPYFLEKYSFLLD